MRNFQTNSPSISTLYIQNTDFGLFGGNSKNDHFLMNMFNRHTVSEPTSRCLDRHVLETIIELISV